VFSAEQLSPTASSSDSASRERAPISPTEWLSREGGDVVVGGALCQQERCAHQHSLACLTLCIRWSWSCAVPHCAHTHSHLLPSHMAQTSAAKQPRPQHTSHIHQRCVGVLQVPDQHSLKFGHFCSCIRIQIAPPKTLALPYPAPTEHGGSGEGEENGGTDRWSDPAQLRTMFALGGPGPALTITRKIRQRQER
jgi:hypothetical protein